MINTYARTRTQTHTNAHTNACMHARRCTQMHADAHTNRRTQSLILSLSLARSLCLGSHRGHIIGIIKRRETGKHEQGQEIAGYARPSWHLARERSTEWEGGREEESGEGVCVMYLYSAVSVCTT